jgi:hypothetical protein
MDVLHTRSDRLATDLLDFALTSPRGPGLQRRPHRGVLRTVRWPPQLDLGLTFACLIDLAGQERLSIDASGSLVVAGVAPTGSPALDLLLRRIAEAGREAPPSSWVWRLRREVANAVLADAVARGQLSAGHHRPRGWGPVGYEPANRAGADQLHAEARRVMRGESQDRRATALCILCVATPLRQLLPPSHESGVLQLLARTRVARAVAYLGSAPRGPQRKSVCRHIEQLPHSAVADAFGHGAIRLGISTVGDVTALIPQVAFGAGPGGGAG